MMRKILSMIRQDFILTLRNGFMWVLLGLMVLMIVLVNLLPREMTSPVRTLIWDQSQGQILRGELLRQGAHTNEFVISYSQLSNAAATNRSIMGVIFSGTLADPRFTLIYQDTRDRQTVNTYKLLMDQIIRQMRGEAVRVGTLQLRPVPQPRPLNLRAVPVLLVFEVLILGFLIVAVTIFAEKDQGSIRAYRVSPGGVGVYILSKTVVFTALGLVYGLPMVLFTVGMGIHYGQLLLVLTVSIAMFTLLGLGLAVYFQNISEWFFMGVMVLIINILSQVSYIFPNFAPGWISWLPSYPALTGITEILFPSGRPDFLGPVLAQLGAYLAVTAVFAYFSVRRKLFREGR